MKNTYEILRYAQNDLLYHLFVLRIEAKYLAHIETGLRIFSFSQDALTRSMSGFYIDL